MAWILGISGGLFSIVAAGWLGKLAAQEWPSLDERLLFFSCLIPYAGFMAGFIPVSKSQRRWPLPGMGLQLAVGLVCGFLCAAGMYLIFATVSFTWNANQLAPEQRSLLYLVLHPMDIPPLNVSTSTPGGSGRNETGIIYVVISFFAGLIGGAMVAKRGN